MIKTPNRTPSLLLLAFLIQAAFPAGPADAASGSLTLEGAMSRARSAALEVEAARLRVEAGARRLSQARAYRLPQVRLQEIWSRTDSPADAFGLQLNQERFSFSDFVAGDPNDPQAIENALTRLELELPLYTGGEIGGRIRQAELAAEAEERTAARIGDEAAFAAAEAYVRLAQIRERVELLERTLKTVGAHVELARAYVDQGLIVRSELLRAQVEAARVEELLVEARGQARVAAANLAFRMGAAAPAAWTLEPLPEPVPLTEPLTSWLAAADERSDLEAARDRLAAGRLEESILKAGRLPRVGLMARHDLYDDTPFGSNGDSTTIMAVASIDLFSGGRHRAAAEAARLEAEAGTRDVERFSRGVRLAVRDAYERALTTREQRSTAAAVLTAASEAERITNQRFENGVARTLDVLDALTARREAEVRELVARAEAQLATLRLALAAGRRPESALPSSPADPEPTSTPRSTDQATETER